MGVRARVASSRALLASPRVFVELVDVDVWAPTGDTWSCRYPDGEWNVPILGTTPSNSSFVSFTDLALRLKHILDLIISPLRNYTFYAVPHTHRCRTCFVNRYAACIRIRLDERTR